MSVQIWISSIAADEALRQEERGLGVFGKQGAELLADVVRVRLALHVDLHEIQGRQHLHGHALLVQVQLHQFGGQQFALADDDLGLHLREELLGEGAQVIEHTVHIILGLLFRFGGTEELGDGRTVFRGQAVDRLGRPVGITVEKVLGDLHEGVGRSRHRRKDHDVPAAAGHQFRDFLDPLGGAN